MLDGLGPGRDAVRCVLGRTIGPARDALLGNFQRYEFILGCCLDFCGSQIRIRTHVQRYDYVFGLLHRFLRDKTPNHNVGLFFIKYNLISLKQKVQRYDSEFSPAKNNAKPKERNHNVENAF